jgi:nicotinamidase-related amidase
MLLLMLSFFYLDLFALSLTLLSLALARTPFCCAPVSRQHCLVGTKGHAVVDDINDALQAWARLKARAVAYVLKGHNMLTEHYSMLKADVERAGKTLCTECRI